MFAPLLALFLVTPAFAARDPPVFVLDCASYPDVCDTHCYALACNAAGATNFRDVNRYLHYDPNSASAQPNSNTSVKAATYRRQAIGCPTSDCATDFLGTDCDEFPYASTYDGGLGCIVDQYGGTDPIARTGVYHCADEDHNSRHGSALRNFYSNSSLGNGGKFQIGFDERNVNQAAGCKIIREGGLGACGRVASVPGTGRYSIRTKKPAAQTYCQVTRGHYRRDAMNGPEGSGTAEPPSIEVPPFDGYVNVTFTRAVDSHGNVILLPYRDDKPPALTRAFHVKRDGSVLQTHLV